jgi:hypothetical protein
VAADPVRHHDDDRCKCGTKWGSPAPSRGAATREVGDRGAATGGDLRGETERGEMADNQIMRRRGR